MLRSPPRRRSPRRWGPATLPLWDMWHPPRVAPAGRPAVTVPAIERVSTCTRPYPSGARPRYGPIVRSRPAALEARVASSRCGTRIRLRKHPHDDLIVPAPALTSGGGAGHASPGGGQRTVEVLRETCRRGIRWAVLPVGRTDSPARAARPEP